MKVVKTQDAIRNFQFKLADGGEGTLNISRQDTYGRFKPNSGSYLYIIETCGVKKPLTDQDHDFGDGLFIDKQGDFYRVEKDIGCPIYYRYNLDSLENPEAKAKLCLSCNDGEMVHNPFNEDFCKKDLKC